MCSSDLFPSHDILGLLLFVTVPSAGPIITGADGAVLSIVIFILFDAGLTFPAVSVAVAVIE